MYRLLQKLLKEFHITYVFRYFIILPRLSHFFFFDLFALRRIVLLNFARKLQPIFMYCLKWYLCLLYLFQCFRAPAYIIRQMLIKSCL